jgi:outer membrane protein OmpA-like peptidoglycan-associated protein
VLEPGEDEAAEPPAPMVRIYWSTGEIDALPGEVRESFRVAERYSLHPAEIVLLDAVVGRIAEDLGAIAQAVGQSSDERMALCANLATAFGYFVRGSRSSEHASTARQYVLAALMSMRGNNTPVDSWADYAPETYYHALAKAHQEFQCFPDAIAEHLGIAPKELTWFATDHTYQFRFHTSLSPTKLLKGFVAGEIDDVLKLLATKGALIGSKLKKPGFSPQYDEIEAEIQKLPPYLAGQDDEWPRGADGPESVWYQGVLVGGAIAASAGMSVAATTEWTSINALGDYWTREDFEGSLGIAGIFWGLSVFGLETALLENPTNWLREKLGNGPIRYNGDVSYTKFTAPPKADIWTLCRGFTNSLGLHVEVGVNATYGELWRPGHEPDLDTRLPGVDRSPLQLTAVSFATGRSELTEDGHALLRQAAADRLHELSSPATSLDVVGHASFGDARPLYNLTLSRCRAANVVRALKAYLGPLYAVRPERTTVIGLGDQESQGDDGPPEQWRRVDVFINGHHAVELRTGAP